MEVDEIIEEIKRFVPILGRNISLKLSIAYLLQDESGRKRIREIVDALKAIVLPDESLSNGILMEPPPQEISSKGKILLGRVVYGKRELYPFFIDEKDLLMHIGIFGSSGSGKTNLVQWLVWQLAKRNIPVLIFDFSKRNYRDLIRIRELKDKIRIFTVGREVCPYRFNPLVPPDGVSIAQWAKEFSEVFDDAYLLFGGGRHIILKALDEIYKKYKPPTLFDLKQWLEEYAEKKLSARERNWVATALRPLQSLCFRDTGKVFNCKIGIKPSELLKGITIMELDGLSTNDKTFFIEIILQWLRDWLIVEGNRENLIGTIVIEEAHYILNREKGKKLGLETVMDLVFREIRELGIGIIYTDQHPSLVSYPALGNTNTHIYMNLGLDTKQTSDIEDAASMLGLKKEEEIDYLRRLPIGYGFILSRKSKFPKPFVLKFPLVPVKRGVVKDEEIKVERKEEIKIDKISKVRLDEVSFNILKAIFEGEAVFTSEIYRRLRISCRNFKKCSERLIKAGLVKRKEIRRNKKKAFIYFLTEEGLFMASRKFKREDFYGDLNFLREKSIQYFKDGGWQIIEDNDNFVRIERNFEEKIVWLVDSDKNAELIAKKILENCDRDNCVIFLNERQLRRFLSNLAMECERLDLSLKLDCRVINKIGEGIEIEFIENG